MNGNNGFPYFRTFITSLGFFTINLTWSAFSIFVPIFLKNNLSTLLGDKPILYTLVGIIMVLDNIAAIIIQPYIGSLSDRIWVKNLGRRLPFIIIGMPLAALFFGLIGTFESMFFLLLVVITGFNISMAIYNTPVISLIPDTLPKEYHSQGNGVMNIVGGLANIVGLLLTSYLYSINHSLAFFTSSIIMIICLIILLINVKEKREIAATESHERVKVFAALKQLFQDKKTILILMLVGVFLHNAGYQIAETFFSSYAKDVLGFQEEQAGYILGIFVVIQIVLALPAGLVARKIGALNACILGVMGFIICLFPIAIISLTDINEIAVIVTLNNLTISWELLIYGFLIVFMGFSWILLAINLLVVVWNMTPEGQTATYTGFYYVFWHLAAILSPFLAGGLFDLIEYITGTGGIRILFLFILICYTIALVVFLTVKRLQSKQITMEIITGKEKEITRDKDLPLRFLPLLLFGIGLRKKEPIKELKQRYRTERKEITKTIQEIKITKSQQDNARKKETKELLKEQRKIKRKKRIEHQRELRELKNEIISQEVKEKIEKEKNQVEK